MQKNDYRTATDVIEAAEKALGKTLRDFIPAKGVTAIEEKLQSYATNRKGFLGNLVEEYIFGIKPNSRAEADFHLANIELKTTPLKTHKTKQFVSKERLVFSMIDYDEIVKETWDTSSFLKKNRYLLLIFYLWLKDQNLLNHEIKFIHFLDLLEGLSQEDVIQIKKDWEFIVAKIDRGEAHLLSEGDTFYLGACTKAANSRVVRGQPRSREPAKPRAFSLKQTYLNYLIQTKLLKRKVGEVSLYKGKPRSKTIDQVINEKFSKYIGKTDKEIRKMLGGHPKGKPKNHKRLLVNHILTGTGSNDIEELEKANITLRVLTLESSGTLKEAISFSAFDYKDLVTQVWYDEEQEMMSDLHIQLESKKFLFVIFQKQKGSDEIVLHKTMFWNFPVEDMEKVREVWETTVELINEGKIIKEVELVKGKERFITHFPGSSFNGVAHVRPHAQNSADTAELPVADQLTGRKKHTKQCFWLNSKYIQSAIEKG